MNVCFASIITRSCIADLRNIKAVACNLHPGPDRSLQHRYHPNLTRNRLLYAAMSFDLFSQRQSVSHAVSLLAKPANRLVALIRRLRKTAIIP